LFPVPSNSSFDWNYIPYDNLPYVQNPKSGFIATANNKITPTNYEFSILADNDWEEPYRAARITEVIKQKAIPSENQITSNKTMEQGLLTMYDMKALQFDYVSLAFRDLRPILEEMQPPYSSSLVGEWRDKLLYWDGNMTKDSTEASVFELW
jgi:penicillin amidase